MAERRNQDSSRFRYGKCLNENCEKSKSKEVITVPARKEFVCPECGSKLFECAPPKQKSKTPLIAAIAVGAAVLIGVGVWVLMHKSTNENSAPQEEVVKVDSIPELKQGNTISINKAEPEAANEAEIKKEHAAGEESAIEKEPVAGKPVAQPKQSSSEHKLDYGVWKGGWKNGKPHDTHGTMKYTASHLIDSRDPKKRMAEPGDYIIGEWSEGKLVQGIWYDSSNTVKGSIMIGQ